MVPSTTVPSNPPVLVDAADNRRLHRDGFVRTRVLERIDAERMREAYLALEPPAGTGFVADLNIDDRPYRERANRLIGERLEAAVVGLFVDHRPFLRNFLRKFPGADSGLYLHRDWMFVDERRGGPTYVVWTALEDITGDNGQLQVLRGSHRIDRDLRGTELGPPWLRHQDAIRERLLTVPVEAGECLIMHNALIHGSLPNHTERTRIVAAVGMRPADQPLAHFRRGSDDTAVRYDIDEEFFLDYTPVSLIAAAPRLEPAEVISVTPTDLTSEQLAELVDRQPLARLDRAARAARDLRGRGAAILRRRVAT